MTPRVHVIEGPSLYCAAPVAIFETDWPARTSACAEDLAEWLQRSLGHRLPETPLAPRDARPPNVVAIRYWDADTAKLAGRAALAMLQAADAARSDAILARFEADASVMDLGPSASDLLDAARARGIPVRRLVFRSKLLLFGQGAKQQRLQHTMTSSTSQMATVISTHKQVAHALFRAHAVPVPRQALVRDARGAVRAATSIGFPVVVKPSSTDKGTAVFVALENAAEVAQAFEAAAKHGPVLVEQHVPGDCYRLLVYRGRLIIAVRREPVAVLGDGRRSLRELIEASNAGNAAEPARQVAFDAELERILRRQGVALAQVPPPAAKVRLRGPANRAQGSSHVVVTADVHPDNRALAERAAALAGIDIAGIDFISPDISRSHLEVGGAICEINVNPGLLVDAEQRFLIGALLELLFPDGDEGRIPIVCLLADRDVSALAGRIEDAMAECGHVPALAAANVLRVNRATLAAGELGQAFACRAALAEVSASAALLQLGSAAVCREGLPFDRCALAIVDAPLADPRAAALLRSCAQSVLERATDEDVLRAVRALLSAAADRPSGCSSGRP